MKIDLDGFDDKLIDGLIFCSLAYEIFEKIRGEVDGASRLRMRASDIEKKLLEEIIPICKYIQANYRTGRYINVRWKSGSQQYDAELSQKGVYIEEGYYPSRAYLEVTSATHPNDYLSRELLDIQGFVFAVDGLRRLKDRSIESIPVIHSNQEFVKDFSRRLLGRIRDKARKPYPENTTLIVSCSLDTPYTPSDWDCLRQLIEQSRPVHQFAEVYIYDTTCEYSFSIWKSK
jgi:hypothetical protein